MQISPRIIAPALFASVMAIYVAHSAFPAAQRLTGGFMAYYVAAQSVRAGTGGARLYDEEWFASEVMEASHGRVTDSYLANPPTLAVAWLPFAYFSVEASRRVWIALDVLFLAVALWLIAVELDWAQRPWAVLALSAAATLAVPTREQIYLGQMYACLLLLHVIGWRAYIHGRSALTGAALGLAMALKLSGWPIGVLMLAKRRWSMAGWALATAGIVALLSLPWVGLDAWRTFILEAIPRTLHWAAATLTAYQDTTGFWQHLFRYDARLNPHPLSNAPALATLLTLSTAVGACIALVACTRTASVAFAGAVALTELLSPAAEQYHYIIMVLPLAVLWHQAWRSNYWPLGCAALAATLLIACPIDYKSVHPVWAILHNYPRLLGGWLAFAALLYGDRMGGIALGDARTAAAQVTVR
jgi:hypothetical protein